MLGVSRLPPWFRQTIATFVSMFTDSRNVPSFEALVSSLILAESQWTVRGLARGITRPDAKSGSAYNYFVSEADWSAPLLAHHLADYMFEQLHIGEGGHITLFIDDTFVPKTGDATDGVARLYNPAMGKREWGNKLVTSSLQAKNIYVPYQARLYILEHLAPAFDEPFKTKLEIAVSDIILPLQLPAGAALTVVFDSAYYASKVITTIRAQGYNVVCRLKTTKHVQPLGLGWSLRVDVFASTLAYEERTITVRGEMKTYHVASELVEIEDVGPVRLVVSETDETRRYYLCTDLDR